ncbi:MAG: hypothetical protein LQ350_003151 [Teloschistes chrysophthalmus]|nr:MAG: hypothetical protein LQ350_003151 [Niorma chrysophthalma]
MAGFTDLPNELIIHFLRLVDPADFDNAAQMSKNVHKVALKELKEHRSLIQESKTPGLLDNNPRNTYALARRVINDPHRSQYYRTLLLSISFGQHPVMLQGPDSPLLDFLNPRTTFERVRQEIVDRGDGMAERLVQYSTEFQLAMILLRVPNVFALMIYLEGNGIGNGLQRSRVWETLAAAAAAAGTPALVLPKVSVVILDGYGVRPYHVTVLGRIPSIKQIFLCSLDVDGAFTADNMNPAVPISIGNLHIAPPNRPGAIHHNFNANSLHAILAACDHNLTTLTLDRIHCFATHYPPDRHVPFLTDMAQVLAPVRTFLRRLVLTNITWSRDGMPNMVKILTSPLTPFANLCHLETHIDEVVFPEECPPSIKHLKFHTEKYFYHDRACGCARARRVLEQAARLHGVVGGAKKVISVEFLCHVGPGPGPDGDGGDRVFRGDVERALREVRRWPVITVKAPDMVGGRLLVEG